MVLVFLEILVEELFKILCLKKCFKLYINFLIIKMLLFSKIPLWYVSTCVSEREKEGEIS